MKKVWLILMLAVFAAGCSNSKEVANVNGTKITEADFTSEMESLPARYKMLAESPDMKRAIVDNLVMTELLIQYAEKEGILSDPEVQKNIKDQESGIKAEADQQILMLKQQKENASKIAKREVVIKAVLDGKDFSDVKVDEKDVKQQYDEYVKRLKAQDPTAKPEAYENIKGEIRKSVARQAWLESLKNGAKVTVNESFIGQQMPSFDPGNIQVAPPAADGK